METKSIGGKIAEARKKANISQAQLAQRMFITPQAIGKWERGESVPDIITCIRLAENLGVDLNYFSDKFQTTVKTPEDVVKETNVTAKKKLNWNMSLGNWVGADFSGLKDLHEKFSSSNMQNCKFIGSEMSGLLLKSNNVENCDFSNSDIRNSKIDSSHLVNNNYSNCLLNDSELSATYLKGCNFSGADFSGAYLKSSAFAKNIIIGAVFNHTSFIGTQIDDTVFDGIIDNCYFELCSFSKVSFKNVTLTNTFFKCKSLKRIKFTDCFADRITYEFLKNGKANMNGIALISDN